MKQPRIQISPADKALMLRLARIVDGNPVALIEYLMSIEKRIPALEGLLESVRGKPGRDGIGKPGKNGVNYYALTDSDKSDIIAAILPRIKVPVVDRIVEKRETVREIPIVREQTTKSVIEKEILPRDIYDRLDAVERKADKKSEDGPPRFTLLGGGSRPIKVFNSGSRVSDNALELDFVNATSISTVGLVGRRVTITLPTGGGSGAWSTPVETPLPDGSVVSFTVGGSAPNEVNIDGAIYPPSTAWSFSGGKISVSIGGRGPTSFIRFR